MAGLTMAAHDTEAQILQMDSLSQKVKNIAQISTLDTLGRKVKDLTQYLWYRDHDSSYITNYSDLVALKLLAINRYTFFRIRDKNLENSIGYRPELGLNLGFGITYNWFSLDITFSTSIQENSIPESDFVDVQGAIFTPKIFVETTLQYYYGYQVSSTDGFSQSILGDAGIRPDIRTINLVLQATYALNFNKFSLKAPFVFSEAQKRSAGSPVFSGGFTLFNLSADSSAVPVPIQSEFDEELHLTGFTAFGLNFGVGYMHTFVYKEHWFLTMGGTPGFSISTGDYRTDARTRRPLNVTYIFKLSGSLGYNGPRFFSGITVLGDINQERINRNLPLIIGHGKTKFFLGYRIGSGKKR
jgi:hypothetical protein